MTDWDEKAREACDHDHSTVGCWTCPNPGLVPCVQCAKIAAALREAEERGKRSERDLLEKLFKAAVLDDYNDAHLAIVQALREAEERGAERAEAERQSWGIVEFAVRYPNVASYMDHWEQRAEKAEAALAAIKCPGCDGSGMNSCEAPGDEECPFGCRGDSFAQVLARADAAEAFAAKAHGEEAWQSLMERAERAEREVERLKNERT